MKADSKSFFAAGRSSPYSRPASYSQRYHGAGDRFGNIGLAEEVSQLLDATPPELGQLSNSCIIFPVRDMWLTEVSQLESLPTEVLILILQMLHPSDLLRLIRVNGYFRRLLLCHSARDIWKRCQTMATPPSCKLPKDHSLNTANLAHLFWGDLCTLCHTMSASDDLVSDFTFCIRYCRSCFGKQIMTRDRLKQLLEPSDRPFLTQTFHVLQHSNFFKDSKRRHTIDETWPFDASEWHLKGMRSRTTGSEVARKEP
ncbi:hypothetical protein BDZ89DRAFT_1040551 [Hymenopellis radicata]|nr:hypothetical protein BDZ89DRAFT_1040551 [Hymenopellis radicata]